MTGKAVDLPHQRIRRDLPAISTVVAQRPLVSFRAQRGAGVGGHRHQVPEIAGIAHRRVDALIGQHAGDDQRPHAEIAQHVVDVGRDEHGRRRLRQHDLVVDRRDRVQHLRIPRTARHEQPADLVVEAQIAPVARQRLDHRVHHLDARTPARRLQSLHVRQRGLAHRAEEIAVSGVAFGLGHRGIFAAIRPRVVVLHIDEQQRGVGGIDRYLAAQHDRRATAAGSSRSNRAAHAACPASSAIRSWRISISTCARPRLSACTGTP